MNTVVKGQAINIYYSIILLIAVLALSSCASFKPENPGEAISLLAVEGDSTTQVLVVKCTNDELTPAQCARAKNDIQKLKDSVQLIKDVWAAGEVAEANARIEQYRMGLVTVQTIIRSASK